MKSIVNKLPDIALTTVIAVPAWLIGKMVQRTWPSNGNKNAAITLNSMSDQSFGLWAGTAVNDTSSVVAAGYTFSNAAGNLAVIDSPSAMALAIHDNQAYTFNVEKEFCRLWPYRTRQNSSVSPAHNYGVCGGILD